MDQNRSVSHESWRIDLLIAQATAEGRVGGRYRCSACGMRFRSQDHAHHCCGAMVVDTRVIPDLGTRQRSHSQPRFINFFKGRSGAP